MTEEMSIEKANERVKELEKQMSEVMRRLEMKAEKGKEKGKEKEKGKVDKDKKKRGMTGYLLFAKEKRPEVKEELVEGGNESPKPTEVITEVAKRWKAMSEEEQGEWNERAKTETDEEE
tara:strand:+ start:217 stop:573 length:357 start_codon:yes stop_codon:yes gene_type:complete